MRKNIIEIKAKQKLTRIMVANITLKGINNAFNKLIKKLTIIADLFTPRRKLKISKGRP
jgi:Mg2+ and Co2+ transporter CorA